MKRTGLKPFLGKPCRVVWRDPTGRSGWTDKPLSDETACIESLCWPIGFNARGELIIAASRGASDKDAGDRNAIPVSLVESVELLGPHPNRKAPRR